MKKVIALILFFAGAACANAQIISKSSVMPSRVQPASLPAENKGLRIKIVDVEKDNSNFAVGSAGIYHVVYEVTNMSDNNLDISDVTIQSYITNAGGAVIQPYGGVGLKPLMGYAVMKPKETYSNKLLAIGLPMPQNVSNRYILKASFTNQPENSTAMIPIAGRLEAWSTPLPDLTFEVSSVSKVPGNGYLNARWEAYLTNTGAGDIPLDVVQKIIAMLQVYPAGSPGTNLYNEAYFMKPTGTGAGAQPGYYRTNAPLKAGEKINISGASHINGFSSGAALTFHFTLSSPGINIPETNTANNTVDFLYTVQ